MAGSPALAVRPFSSWDVVTTHSSAAKELLRGKEQRGCVSSSRGRVRVKESRTISTISANSTIKNQLFKLGQEAAPFEPCGKRTGGKGKKTKHVHPAAVAAKQLGGRRLSFTPLARLNLQMCKFRKEVAIAV